MKRDIKQFEEKSIIIDIHPLTIEKDLIQIENHTSNEIEISTLPPLFRTIDFSDSNKLTMASNNRYLLMDQHPNLYLFDKELTIVKESPWNYGYITDMCWSSTLDSFIIITEKNGVFLINEDITLTERIETIEKNKWLLCTCSDASLYLLTNPPNSTIFQLNLLSSFNLIKQWNPPETCNNNEIIHNIAYNYGTLALLIKHGSYSEIKIEVRSSTTFDRVWSLSLDLSTKYVESVFRVCLLKCGEWLIIDHKNLRLLHISKDGKLKTTKKYDPTPRNAVLFGSDNLAIRTTKCVNFYKV